jgi:TonB-linked SusC/RagA family outer membrane protein
MAVGAVALGSALPAGVGAQGATGTIQGTVIDAGTRRPLPGAQVFIAGTQVGGVTNAEGVYRILNVSEGQRELRLRLIGYAPATQTVTVAAGQTATANFSVTQSALELSAVVVTGTGGAVVEERKLGNTVAQIEPPPFAPISDFSQVLQGREPGVVGLPSSGATGEGARIRIRGNASLSQSNEPIVYVDGVRLNSGGGFGEGFAGTGGGGAPSRLDDIDPSSIERVEVLKGAAAATLYGTEASNGVIQIFTKKGSSGAARWTFNAEQAALRYPEGRMEDQFGFARSDTQAVRLSSYYGRTLQPFQVFSEPFAKELFETGQATALSGQVNGGTNSVNYFVSGRYYNEDGPLGGDHFAEGREDPIRTKDIARRYQGTANLGINLSRQLTMNVRTLYTDSRNELPQLNNNIYAPYTLLMFSKPERVNCIGSEPVNGAARCTGFGNPTGASSFATPYEALQQSLEQNARHFNGTVQANYTPLASLALNGTVGVDFTSQRTEGFLPFGNNLDLINENAPQGDLDLDNNTHQEITLGTNGTWTYDITPRISSSLLFGAQGFITRDNLEAAQSQSFPGRGIEVLNGGASQTTFSAFTSVVNAGFFAQEQLGLNDWIFGTIGARYDYNSAFGQTADGVLYPQASLSVIPSDREGWSVPYLSTFRLRAAIGQAGRQPGAFDKLTTYQALQGQAGAGLVPFNLGNPDLKPEVSTEWEVGTELGVLDNRLALEFTRWNRVVNDLLVAKQFPVTGGFRQQQLTNVGEMSAFGWELGLKGIAVNRPNLTVDLFANSAFISQQVTSLGGAAPLKVGGAYPRYRNYIVEGQAPGILLGAQLLHSACPAGATALPSGGPCLQSGQLPFDVNADGTPDTEADLLAFLSQPRPLNATVDPLPENTDGDSDILDQVLGKPYPDFQGSFGGTITFLKNWRFGNLFEYKAGNYTITDLTGAFRRSSATNGGNTRRRAEVESTMLNPASTPEQRLEALKIYANELRGLTPFDGLNQNFSGDFLRWREMSLTYIFPAQWASRMGTSDFSLTFAARNLALWTKYPGVDPEVNVAGRGGLTAQGGGAQNSVDNNFGDAIDAFGLPLPRRFSLSLRASF